MEVAQREIPNTTEELHPVSHLDKEKESTYCHPGQVYTAERVQSTLWRFHVIIQQEQVHLFVPAGRTKLSLELRQRGGSITTS